MNVSFDLDGVLVDIDIPSLYLGDHGLPDDCYDNYEHHYYRSRKPLINPELFLAHNDNFYIITARHMSLYNITKDWCDKFVPNHKGLYVVGKTSRKKMNEPFETYFNRAVREKARIIKELDIKIHFEDSPRGVELLRELLPDVVIIQYGGRLYGKP